MSSKPVRCFVDPYADPLLDAPNFHISLADAEDRVQNLGCCYWVDERTVQYYAREQRPVRSMEELIAAGTFAQAWKQLPSGPERMLVWQMPTRDRYKEKP